MVFSKLIERVRKFLRHLDYPTDRYLLITKFISLDRIDTITPIAEYNLDRLISGDETDELIDLLRQYDYSFGEAKEKALDIANARIPANSWGYISSACPFTDIDAVKIQITGMKKQLAILDRWAIEESLPGGIDTDQVEYLNNLIKKLRGLNFNPYPLELIVGEERKEEFLKDYRRLKDRFDSDDNSFDDYDSMFTTFTYYLLEQLIDAGEIPVPSKDYIFKKGNQRRLFSSGGNYTSISKIKNTSKIIVRFVEKGWMKYFLESFGDDYDSMFVPANELRKIFDEVDRKYAS